MLSLLLVQAEKGDDKEGKQLLQKCMGKVGVFLIITIALVWSRIKTCALRTCPTNSS